MDLNEFSQPGFDPKQWLNRNVSCFKDDGKINVALLSVELQSCFNRLNGEFECSAQKVIQNLPLVIRETDVLSEEAKKLKEMMASVKQEIAKVERDTGASIASLKKMDNLKMELEGAKQALHEADKWTVLSSEVEQALSGGEIELVASKLLSMENSLTVLSSAGDYEKKKEKLEGLKNSLEALVVPCLFEAFNEKSAEQLKKYVNMFEGMRRLPGFLKYYTECQKGFLHKRWIEGVQLEETDIAEYLQNYFDLLLSNWQEQVQLFKFVVPNFNISKTLTQLHISLFEMLLQDIKTLMNDQLKSMSEPLKLLLQLKNICQEFVLKLKPLLDSSNLTLDFLKAVHLPLVHHINKYGAYQQASYALSMTHCKLGSNVHDKNFADCNAKILSVVSDAWLMCNRLTHGCSAFGFADATKWFLLEYLKEYQWVSLSSQEHTNIFQTCLTLLEGLGGFLNDVKQHDTEFVENIIQLQLLLTKKDIDPFTMYSKYLLGTAEEEKFHVNIAKLQSQPEASMYEVVVQEIHKVCQEVFESTIEVIFSPIETQLKFIETNAWKEKQETLSPDLPDYSVIPLEYAVQIGQYLLNLPQLLEPFMAAENLYLTLALYFVRLKYPQIEPHSEETSFAEIFLVQITRKTCHTYYQLVLELKNLSSSASKQLATDISYLGKVFEDLGSGLTEKLKQVAILLKLSESEYVSQCAGCSPKLVAVIREIRNIKTIDN